MEFEVGRIGTNTTGKTRNVPLLSHYEYKKITYVKLIDKNLDEDVYKIEDELIDVLRRDGAFSSSVNFNTFVEKADRYYKEILNNIADLGKRYYNK